MVFYEFNIWTTFRGSGQGLTDPEFARALFQGALDEKEKCGDEELAERIKWIKATILDSFIKNQARSSN